MAKWHPLEDMDGFKDFATLEVDSVVDLIVPIANETLDAELAGVQHVLGLWQTPAWYRFTRWGLGHRSRPTLVVRSLPL